MNNPNGSSPNRIDPTGSPVRMSTNLTVDRQTPKTDFGERLKSGVDSAAGAVANGAAVAAPFVPGGAILSAAVSSLSTMAHGQSSGPSYGSGGASVAAYASQGVVNIGNGGAGQGGVNTTVTGTGGTTNQTGVVLGTTTPSTPNYVPGGTMGGMVGQFNNDLASMQVENAKMLQVQMAMQRENQTFTTVSNVLKTRHDTVKNTISNVR